MKTSILKLISFFFLIFVFNETTAQAISNPEAEVRKRHGEFQAAFNKSDAEKIGRNYIQTPLNLGRWLNTAEDAIQFFDTIFKQMKQEGWVESKVLSIKLCTLSETLVFLDNEYSRLKEDGSTIAGPPVRKTLQVWQKIEDEWRIVAFYGHDPSIRIACEK